LHSSVNAILTTQNGRQRNIPPSSKKDTNVNAEYVAVTIAILAALVFLVWRVVRTVRNSGKNGGCGCGCCRMPNLDKPRPPEEIKK
jgi:hypothetical protein